MCSGLLGLSPYFAGVVTQICRCRSGVAGVVWVCWGRCPDLLGSLPGFAGGFGFVWFVALICRDRCPDLLQLFGFAAVVALVCWGHFLDLEGVFGFARFVAVLCWRCCLNLLGSFRFAGVVALVCWGIRYWGSESASVQIGMNPLELLGGSVLSD